jgi:thiamine-monophosphate kinase
MKTEFEFINNIKDRFAARRIGDDCAVLPKDETTDQLVTADLLVEDIDFRLDWTTPELLGQKALAVSLSDIAAMGGTPRWSMTTVGVPRHVWDSDFLDRFYDGWSKLAGRYGVELVGGDVSRTPDKLVIDSIVGGEAPRGRAVLRSGARPGDLIFVSGSLGGAAGGLALLESGIRYKDADEHRKRLITRQLRPTPRVELGQYLLKNGLASSMIDVSDGISSDLHHICEASGVGATLAFAKIPFDPDLTTFSPGDSSHARNVWSGGEDFELLVTVPPEKITRHDTSEISQIGEVTANAGIIEVTNDGETYVLPPTGFTHF